jgi:release factor glutamine methyltransferase
MTQDAPQTVAEALVRATSRLHESGSESPRLDAEVLLGHVLGVERSALIAHGSAPLGDGQREQFETYLSRRDEGEPVAYIRGIKEFYGVALSVDPRVLVPRPESETLSDLALERIREDLTGAPRSADADPYLVWDIGTGSGAIPIAIAMELRRLRYGDAVRYFLSDLSPDALDVALVNAVSHGVAHQMTFARGDLTDIEPAPARPVELLTSNLPYIPSDDMGSLPVATSFEPSLALDGGEDGLDVIRRLMASLGDVLAQGGTALLEIGSDQVDSATAVAADALPGWRVSVHPDLSGSPRVVQLERADD